MQKPWPHVLRPGLFMFQIRRVSGVLRPGSACRFGQRLIEIGNQVIGVFRAN